MRSNEVPTHDRDGARRAHSTVHEHARIGAPAERACDIARGAREVRSELRERRVVQRDLDRVSCERGGQRDASGHCGDHVRDAERGECCVVFGGLQVRDVQAREDLGDVWGGGGGRRRRRCGCGRGCGCGCVG